MFRIDESVERAEVLQGGPGVVYSNGQLGATANFILRQGTADPHGDIGLTFGTDHGYRVDGFYGGPLTQDWFFSLGGFYRYSEGVRDSQFPADNGGQLTGTLSHNWDNGKILFYARVLNDKNLFITDVPVTVSGTGKSQSVSAFPGFNPNTGTFAGDGLRGIRCRKPRARRRSPPTWRTGAARTCTPSATISICSSPTPSPSAISCSTRGAT